MTGPEAENVKTKQFVNKTTGIKGEVYLLVHIVTWGRGMKPMKGCMGERKSSKAKADGAQINTINPPSPTE